MVKINDFDSIAEYYDLLEQKNQPLYNLINNFLIKLFKENKARSILDFTCGTGAQAIPLAQQGFDVVGCDIGKNLLRIAKAKSRGLNIKFKCGDVRFSKVGKFDAIISILNSMGYLSKKDFVKALKNINLNLKIGGLFIFDNTNKTWLDVGNLTEDKIIDTAGELNGIKFVRFCTSRYDRKNGTMITNWELIVQKGYNKPIIRKGIWKRQTYSVNEVKKIFDVTGFKFETVYDRTRTLKDFDEKRSFSYLIIAKKQKDIQTTTQTSLLLG